MPTTLNETNRKVLVGTSPTLIARANPARRMLVLQNQGTKLMYVGFGSALQADSGLALGIFASEAGGGAETLRLTNESDNVSTQAIYAKTATAGIIVVTENSDGLPAPVPADISSSSSSSSTAITNSSSSSSSSTAAQNSSSSSSSRGISSSSSSSSRGVSSSSSSSSLGLSSSSSSSSLGLSSSSSSSQSVSSSSSSNGLSSSSSSYDD